MSNFLMIRKNIAISLYNSITQKLHTKQSNLMPLNPAQVAKGRNSCRFDLWHLCPRILGGSLLLNHCPRLRPLHPHLQVPRQGLRLELASEAPSRADIALRAHSFQVDVVLCWTCFFSHYDLRYRSTISLLWYRIGYGGSTRAWSPPLSPTQTGSFESNTLFLKNFLSFEVNKHNMRWALLIKTGLVCIHSFFLFFWL